MHHKYTNILGMDDDLGYGLSGSPGTPVEAVQLVERGVEHDALGAVRGGIRPAAPGDRQDRQGPRRPDRDVGPAARVLDKTGRQLFKDYVAFPALTSLSPGATFKST